MWWFQQDPCMLYETRTSSVTQAKWTQNRLSTHCVLKVRWCLTVREQTGALRKPCAVQHRNTGEVGRGSVIGMLTSHTWKITAYYLTAFMHNCLFKVVTLNMFLLIYNLYLNIVSSWKVKKKIVCVHVKIPVVNFTVMWLRVFSTHIK